MPFELGMGCGWDGVGCAGVLLVDDTAKYGGTTAVFLTVADSDEELLGRGTKVGMRVGTEERGGTVVEWGGAVVEERGDVVGEEKGEAVFMEPAERPKSSAAMGLRRGMGVSGRAVGVEETPCVDVGAELGLVA